MGWKKIFARSRVPLHSAKQTDVRSLKKHLIAFLVIKDRSERFGLGSFELKLYRLCKVGGKTENYAIVTTEQWQLELPSLVAETGANELIGKFLKTNL